MNKYQNCTPVYSKQRYNWIDNAKFLSIFLVVLFHCPPPFYGYADALLRHIRMPFFFFIAGMLFRFEKYPSFSRFISHRSKQLLIPYFSFFLIFYLFWIFAGRALSSPEEATMPAYYPLLEYLYGRPRSICWPLWFIPCLFTMQCYFFLFRGLKRKYVLPILLFLPFIPVFIDMSDSPWMLNAVCYYFPYYGIANLYKQEIVSFVENPRDKKMAIVLAGILAAVSITFFFLHIEKEYLKVIPDILCRIMLVLSFLVIIKYISDRWGTNKAVDYIAKNTIVVLACHTYMIKICWIFFTQIAGYGNVFFDGKYFLKLIMAIVITFSMIIPIYIINRYFPFILGRRKNF